LKTEFAVAKGDYLCEGGKVWKKCEGGGRGNDTRPVKDDLKTQLDRWSKKKEIWGEKVRFLPRKFNLKREENVGAAGKDKTRDEKKGGDEPI